MGFFDRFYYGKAGQADYTPDDMPSNRWQLFGTVLKTRFWSLMRVNLMQLIFWLPFIIITAMLLMAINLQLGQIMEGNSPADPNWLFNLLYTHCLLMVPCLLITGPSSAAAAYVTRNWSRDQHSFIWSDFWDAFKGNWKQALAVSAITSVLPLLLFIGYRFYGDLAAQYPVLIIAQALIIMAGVVWVLMQTLIYPMMVSYELKFGTLLRNTLLLTVGRLPFVAGIRLLTLLPLIISAVVLYFVGSWGLLIGALYYLLIGYALYRLACASFANSVFDKYINPRIEGAPVNQGLREPDDNEDDDQ